MTGVLLVSYLSQNCTKKKYINASTLLDTLPPPYPYQPLCCARESLECTDLVHTHKYIGGSIK